MSPPLWWCVLVVAFFLHSTLRPWQEEWWFMVFAFLAVCGVGFLLI